MHSKTDSIPLTWNLQSLFKKKGEGEEYAQLVKTIHSNLKELTSLVNHSTSLAETISLAQNISTDLAEVSSFVHCLLAEDTTYAYSLQLQGEVIKLQADLENLLIVIDEQLKLLDPAAFQELLTNPLCKELSFPLAERKELAEHKLPLSLESLINSLSMDGYHGYSQLFYLLHGSLRFPVPTQEGSIEYLSTGQIDNRLSDPSRPIREQAFSIYKKTFKEREALFAETLNHIAGFRLQVYSKRGWESVLREPLACNRMQPETLDAMWKAVNANLSPFIQYLEHKAKLMGLKQLSWHDIDIPLSETATFIPYQEACAFILDQFQKYSPRMATFSKKALQQGWVEAEDRPNKSAGGFCVGLPRAKESRIFMTYSGTAHNLSTLAHELGHAYHNEMIFTHPYFAQNIKMNVAETASTMAEMIVADAALQLASSAEEKLKLIDDKLSRSVVYFMNIQARFLFETAFYQERKEGYVLPQRLCILMEEAQKQAFRDTLSEWHPHFWASKLHFYSTDVPFYNFPYTFGYLFSLGIYSLLKQDPKNFERKYDAFLLDTPLMTSEQLAKKHFGVDLTETLFWDLAMQEAAKDIKVFLSIKN